MDDEFVTISVEELCNLRQQAALVPQLQAQAALVPQLQARVGAAVPEVAAVPAVAAVPVPPPGSSSGASGRGARRGSRHTDRSALSVILR
jgi:predicted fused transcriptional regulator/phosphomethylpyrimidine kinase